MHLKCQLHISCIIQKIDIKKNQTIENSSGITKYLTQTCLIVWHWMTQKIFSSIFLRIGVQYPFQLHRRFVRLVFSSKYLWKHQLKTEQRWILLLPWSFRHIYLLENDTIPTTYPRIEMKGMGWNCAVHKLKLICLFQPFFKLYVYLSFIRRS